MRRSEHLHHRLLQHDRLHLHLRFHLHHRLLPGDEREFRLHLPECHQEARGHREAHGHREAVATATKKPTATKVPATGSSLTAMAADVVRQTNAERAKQGLGALTVSSELTRAACVRAQEIVKKFSHTRPDGSAWSTASSALRGENIAMGQQSADKVMAAWMSSSGHRANILRSSFGSIGVCAYKVGNTMYWAQEFGK